MPCKYYINCALAFLGRFVPSGHRVRASLLAPRSGAIAAAILLTACSSYNPLPLTRRGIDARLSPPPSEMIRCEASRIRHPILKPVHFDESDGLSPDELAVMAVLLNPRLRAIRGERAIASAGVLQAGILPNPQLGLSAEFPHGKEGAVNAYSRGVEWEATSLITLCAKKQTALAQYQAVDLDVLWEEWLAAEDARLHAFRLMCIDEKIAILKQTQLDLRKYSDSAKRGCETGTGSKLDCDVSEKAIHEIHDRLHQVEEVRRTEMQELKRAAGLSQGCDLRLQRGAELPDGRLRIGTQELCEQMDNCRIDLVALRSGYESQEARVWSAVLSQFPSVSIGRGYSRGTDGVRTRDASLSVEIPIFDRRQGLIAAEKATRQKLYDEYANRVFESRSDIAEAAAEIKDVREQLRYKEEAIRVNQRLRADYEELLKSGKGDLQT